MGLVKKLLLSFTVLLFGLSFMAKDAYALTWGLVAPQENLAAGQEVDFTITINTDGENVTTATIGMTYQTSFMTYVRTTAGNAMDSVSATESQTGRIIFNGTKSSGFTGSGEYARVTFKINADASGSETCALFIPDTPAPTSPPCTNCATPTPVCTTCTAPTSPPRPTNPPVPTALPQTGSLTEVSYSRMLIVSLLFIFGGSYLYSKKSRAQ